MIHASIPDIASRALRSNDLWVEQDCVSPAWDCVAGLGFLFPVNPLRTSIAVCEAKMVDVLTSDVL